MRVELIERVERRLKEPLFRLAPWPRARVLVQRAEVCRGNASRKELVRSCEKSMGMEWAEKRYRPPLSASVGTEEVSLALQMGVGLGEDAYPEKCPTAACRLARMSSQRGCGLR